MSQYPFVSIIIPTANRSALVVETIDSILQQSYIHFELIIVQNYLSDELILAENQTNDKRLKVYKLEAHSTEPANNRNFGIQKSNGGLIAFCDDDDLWLPEKLEKQVSYLMNHPHVSLLATNVNYFNQTDGSIGGLKELKNRLNTFIAAKYLIAFYNCVVISSAIVTRESLLKAGTFTEGHHLRGHEDIDLWIRICLAHEIRILPEKLIRYRIHSNQLTANNPLEYKKQALLVSRNYFSRFNLVQKMIFSIRMLIYYLTGK